MNQTTSDISTRIDYSALETLNMAAVEEQVDEGFKNATISTEYVFDSLSVRIFFYLLYTFVFCLCFFGNFTVLIVVAFHWGVKSVTKLFIGNLAFANFCVGVFCVYQNLTTFLSENWALGRTLCKMYYFVTSLSHTASILILVVICVERYVSIVNQFRGRKILAIQRLRLTLAAVWLISAMICSPRLYYITTFEVPLMTGPAAGEYEVICAPKRTLYDSRTVDMVYFVLLFVIPLIVMSVLYARIGAVIWKTSTVLMVSSEGESSQTVSQVQISNLSADQMPNVPHNSFATSTSEGQKESSENSASGRAMLAPSSSVVTTASSSSLRSCSQPHPMYLEKLNRKQRGEQNSIFHLGGVNPLDCLPSIVPQIHQDYAPFHAHCVPRELQVTTRRLIQVQSGRREKALKYLQAGIRMFIALVASFAICNFPYHLRRICQYYMPNYNVGSYFNQIFTPLTFLLMYTNCAVNPIIYSFMSKRFRMSLRDLMRLDSKRKIQPRNDVGRRQRLGV